MPPWSIRNWLAHHVGTAPDKLLMLAHSSTPGRVSVATYRTPSNERLSVAAMRDAHFWRISARHGERWLRAAPAAERELRW